MQRELLFPPVCEVLETFTRLFVPHVAPDHSRHVLSRSQAACQPWAIEAQQLDKTLSVLVVAYHEI